MSLDTVSVVQRIESLEKDPWEGFADARVEVGDPLFAALGLPKQQELDA
jgi:hypothetical protein